MKREATYSPSALSPDGLTNLSLHMCCAFAVLRDVCCSQCLSFTVAYVQLTPSVRLLDILVQQLFTRGYKMKRNFSFCVTRPGRWVLFRTPDCCNALFVAVIAIGRWTC